MGQDCIELLAETESERRGAERLSVKWPALIKQPCLRPMAIEVSDMSSHGCGFAADGHLPPGTRILLDLPGLEIWAATVVWCRDGRGGLSFSRPMHPAVAARFAV